MMIGLDITNFDPPDGMKRRHVRAMKALYERIGQRWATTYLPMHVEPGAEERYGYQARSPATLKKKQRLAAKGLIAMPIRSLVLYSRLGKALKHFQVRGFPTRATVRIETPTDKRTGRQYVTINPRNPARPHLYRELGRVVDSEKRDLESQGRAEYEAEFERQKKSRGRPKKTKIT